MKEALKKAREYALKQGYPSEVTYQKKWRLSHVFRMKQPADKSYFRLVACLRSRKIKARVRQIREK